MKFNNQTDYWNDVAKDKEFTTTLNYDLISGLINKDAQIVDYGCGYGRILNELYSRGFENLTGFDFAKNMIKYGQKKYPHLNLKVCNNNKIDCDSNTVDLVILFAVLTCIVFNPAQKELISEIRRVLKPGGLIYINDFLLNDDERNRSRYEKYFDKYGMYGVFELTEGAVLRHHHENWIFELTSGFKNKINQKVKFKTMNGHLSNGIIFIGRK